MYQQRDFELIYDSLSIGGVDGSLRKRLKDIPGQVHAKTGTMRGVRALAGYVGDNARPRYAFAVLFNGYKGPSTPYKAIQERICRILAGSGG
jgi:D-alanyl-D-alanine carboxypeptidase/D-alanyl-D-alanine-endopeptidase (penicillin-binding protein 4)